MSEHEHEDMIREAMARLAERVTRVEGWEHIAAWGVYLSNPNVELRSDETGTVLQMWQDGAFVAAFDLVTGEQA